MFMIYALMFAISIMAVMSTHAEDRQIHEAGRSAAAATQMASWHQAALKWCHAGPCEDGEIDARGHLPTMLRAAPVYGSGAFKSGAEGGLIYTWLDDERLPAGVVASAVLERLQGQSGAGVYDARAGVIRGSSGERAISAGIPHGVAVLLTKAR